MFVYENFDEILKGFVEINRKQMCILLLPAVVIC